MIAKLNIFFSTIPRNYGGAGAYLDRLADTKKNYIKIFPHDFKLKYNLLNRYVLAVQVIFIRFFVKTLSCLNLINEIILYHPQTIGYSLSSKIINNSSKCIYYILDSSFFCKKSYNEYEGKNCLNCLTSYNPYDSCFFFPLKHKELDYIFFLETIQSNICKIQFIVQHKGIENLIKKKFSEDCEVLVEKMLTNDFYKLQKVDKLNFNFKYNFVFHGHKLDAKGFKYSIELATIMTNFNFFFPFNESNCNLVNITFKPQKWESGLMQTIFDSSIVLVPSVWTAPVESALIKSMLLGKPICVFNFENSIAENLLPKDSYIPLSGNLEFDVKLLKEILSNTKKLESIGEKGKKWALNYINYEN